MLLTEGLDDTAQDGSLGTAGFDSEKGGGRPHKAGTEGRGRTGRVVRWQCRSRKGKEREGGGPPAQQASARPSSGSTQQA